MAEDFQELGAWDDEWEKVGEDPEKRAELKAQLVRFAFADDQLDWWFSFCRIDSTNAYGTWQHIDVSSLFQSFTFHVWFIEGVVMSRGLYGEEFIVHKHPRSSRDLLQSLFTESRFYRIRGIVENVLSAWNGENGIVASAMNARME